jgi:hypothetical protein
MRSANFSTYYSAILLLLVFATPGSAVAQLLEKDSVTRPDFVITPRLNSAGYFPYTGALLNKNTNFDVNVFFEYRSKYGFFLFKSVDLEDRRSYVNYLQPGIFRTFQATKNFKLRLFFGYVFSQTRGFRDPDSDYYTALVGYYTIGENMKLENTALFYDLANSAKLANRLLLSWSVASFTAEFYVWHRIVFDDNSQATSASFAITLPGIIISPSTSIKTTISYQGYLTENKPDFAMRDGFLFQVAIPIAVKL